MCIFIPITLHNLSLSEVSVLKYEGVLGCKEREWKTVKGFFHAHFLGEERSVEGPPEVERVENEYFFYSTSLSSINSL